MRNRKGFTLLEVLIALALLTALAVPTGLWFYKSQLHQRAERRYYAHQVLEREMLKAYLEQEDKRHIVEIREPRYLKVVVDVKKHKNEILYKGSVETRSGTALATLVMGRYGFY